MYSHISILIVIFEYSTWSRHVLSCVSVVKYNITPTFATRRFGVHMGQCNWCLNKHPNLKSRRRLVCPKHRAHTMYEALLFLNVTWNQISRCVSEWRTESRWMDL